jgi:hypothetical protein
MGLTFFKRMHSNGTPINSFIVASWHNPNSITWRWSISYSIRNAGQTGVYFIRVYRGRGFNFHAGINLPMFGSLSIQTQPSIWIKQKAAHGIKGEA